MSDSFNIDDELNDMNFQDGLDFSLPASDSIMNPLDRLDKEDTEIELFSNITNKLVADENIGLIDVNKKRRLLLERENKEKELRNKELEKQKNSSRSIYEKDLYQHSSEQLNQIKDQERQKQEHLNRAREQERQKQDQLNWAREQDHQKQEQLNWAREQDHQKQEQLNRAKEQEHQKQEQLNRAKEQEHQKQMRFRQDQERQKQMKLQQEQDVLDKIQQDHEQEHQKILAEQQKIQLQINQQKKINLEKKNAQSLIGATAVGVTGGVAMAVTSNTSKSTMAKVWLTIMNNKVFAFAIVGFIIIIILVLSYIIYTKYVSSKNKKLAEADAVCAIPNSLDEPVKNTPTIVNDSKPTPPPMSGANTESKLNNLKNTINSESEQEIESMAVSTPLENLTKTIENMPEPLKGMVKQSIKQNSEQIHSMDEANRVAMISNIINGIITRIKMQQSSLQNTPQTTPASKLENGSSQNSNNSVLQNYEDYNNKPQTNIKPQHSYKQSSTLSDNTPNTMSIQSSSSSSELEDFDGILEPNISSFGRSMNDSKYNTQTDDDAPSQDELLGDKKDDEFERSMAELNHTSKKGRLTLAEKSKNLNKLS